MGDMAGGNSTRELPPGEWHRLKALGPFGEAGVLPDPAFASVIVEETPDGEIVGCWTATTIVLLEGLWRKPEARGVVGSARRLLMGMVGFLRAVGVKTAITVIQAPEVEVLAKKAGFVAVPGGGRLYTVTMAQAQTQPEEKE